MPRVDHVVFRVADLERSIAFYEQVLPARVIARRDGQDRWRSRVVWLQPDGQEGFAVVLIQPTRVRWVLRALHALTPRFARSFEHFGLACGSREEVAARYASALRHGARPLNAPAFVDERSGFVSEVADPDGNPIEWTFGQRWG
jgi:catechol 2,3-dioxygenase-like lactoylglutathione lyase family enzyme